MLNAFKSIGSFPKALDDFRIKTTSGAIGIYCNNIFHFIQWFSPVSPSVDSICSFHGFIIILRDEIFLQDSKNKYHVIPIKIV